MTGCWIIRKIIIYLNIILILISNIIFRIIQRTEVNYSAYTTVATPQDIDQMIFKAFVRFFSLNHYCDWIISSASHPAPPLLIPQRHFKL